MGRFLLKLLRIGLKRHSGRFVAALFGSLSIFVIYLLVREISKNNNLSLISAFVLSISPTHVDFSRTAYNNVLGAFFAMACTLFFIRWCKKVDLKTLLIATLFFILAIFSYQAYRVFMPSVLIGIGLIYFIGSEVKNRVKIGLVLLGFIILTGISLIPPQSRTRSQNYSILVNQPKLTEQFSEDNQAGTKLILTRIFHNKAVGIGMGVIKRYLSYLDPSFLFVSVNDNAERHATPDVGLLYLIEAPLFLLGLLFIFKVINSKEAYIPLILLSASPLAASLVVEPRSTIRTVVITCAFSAIIAVGIYSLIQIKFWGKIFGILVALAYAANFLYVFHQYTVHKIYHHPWHNDVGLGEMVNSVNKLQSGYSAVVMAHAHYMPYLFFNKVLPSDFINNSTFSEKPAGGEIRTKRYGKIYFNMPYYCPPAGKTGVLYVCFGNKVPDAAKVINVIRYRDTLPAIVLVEFEAGRNIINPRHSLPERLEYMREVPKEFPLGILPENYENFWPTK